MTPLAATNLETELAFAEEMADIADAISLRLFRSIDLAVHTKPDLTPVSEADRAIEQAVRDQVARQRPGHVVVGEEFGGDVKARAGWRWVVDPIDGTKSFVRGNETWGTLIALQHEGRSVVAVASLPALGNRYTAMRGGGAMCDGRRLQVSRIDSIERALMAHTSLSGFARVGMTEDLMRLAARCWDAMGLGNTLSHLAVARGSADIGWTSRANLWDHAAVSLIVEEAGGRFLDRSGDGPLGGTGLSTNGLLHDEVVRLTDANRNRHP